ncbi:MAG: hypothetical protein PHT40_01835 [Patescibacteria group bacterium]|nr:hypothetical protein [Patescibacteria group bacterium]
MAGEEDGLIPLGAVEYQDGMVSSWLFADEDTFFELIVDDEGDLFFSGWTFFYYFDEETQENKTKFEFLPEVKNFPFLRNKQPLRLIQ